MKVDLVIAYPSMEITDVRVLFEEHPYEQCPTITSGYRKLIGMSISRGFTRAVREAFGGPNGCSHTTALLQAMAPVAMQCSWSMTSSEFNRATELALQRGEPAPELDVTEVRQRDAWFMVNSCHVWVDGGERATATAERSDLDEAIFVRRRRAELERDSGG
jgi:hypothetical protein